MTCIGLASMLGGVHHPSAPVVAGPAVSVVRRDGVSARRSARQSPAMLVPTPTPAASLDSRSSASSRHEIPAPPTLACNRGKAMQWAVSAWLSVALLGQLIFASYVIALYGGSALAGRFEQWNAVTPRGWRADDIVGNLVFGSHVMFTVVIVMGGLIQLLPALRRWSSSLHRWNGRLYVGAAVVLALGGVVMILTRGAVGGIWQQLGTSVNGLAILICAMLAWQYARRGNLVQHRRWALRLFLCVSGVFFFRIGLMAWLAAFQAPVGFDPKTFSGPFLTALAFGQFLLPLGVLELVFHAQDTARREVRAATTLLVAVLTLFTALGIAMATVGMWLPRV